MISKIKSFFKSLFIKKKSNDNKSKLNFKVYKYSKNKYFYMTLNEMQIGPVYFSEKDVLKAIENLKKGNNNE